uniref:COesterase domain-containing protein n=1 Tax=Panagrellus redivivus TaxID=6233 RepID=A0A7E4WDC7_PANRE
MISYFTLCIVCILCTAFASLDGPPRAKTPLGTIVGINYSNITEAFLGVPYARPPIGKLRFDRPKPISKWAGTLYANTTGFTCVQLGRNDTSEDCLYINIFRKRNTTYGANLPVLVWVHGGSFQYGSGNEFKPFVQSFVDKGIVLVTVNYRLGPFGFFNGRNDGLYDVIEALTVVNKIIDSLGGNSDNVTLMGQSSGAASVSYITLNPNANHLFSKVITLSGVSQDAWANTPRYVKKTSQLLAQQLGCKSNNLRCLRKKSTAEVLGVTNNVVPEIVPEDSLFISFNPQKDNKFIQATSFKSAIANSPKRPHLYGFTYQEAGTLAVILENSPATHFPITPEKAETYTANDLKKTIRSLIYNGNKYSLNATKEIQNYYIAVQPDANYTHHFYVQKLAQLLSDLSFNIGSLREAVTRAESDNKEVYVYQYDYFVRDNSTYFIDGPSHADDLIDLVYGRVSNEELKQGYISFLVNFIKTGKPFLSYVEAKPINPAKTEIPYVRIDAPTFTNEPDLWSGRLQFWNNITKTYGVDWPMGQISRED